MKTVLAKVLFVIALFMSVAVWAQDSAGGNSEPPKEQTDESSTAKTPDPKPDPQPAPKPAESSAEPGCSE